MIERDIMRGLEEWKGRKNRKPLIITGSRQVGKTTVVKEFGKRYKQFLYFNLEADVDYHLFDNDLRMHELVQSIFLARNATLTESDTLIFLDEIQESPRTIRRLRYFYEEFPQLHVIAAGSLLDHALGDIGAFPVGRVEYMALNPLNFIEFLRALGQNKVIEAIGQIPVPGFSHGIVLELFQKYAMIGGMPEVVEYYAATKDLADLGQLYDSLIEGYQNDVEKYGRNRTERQVLRHLIQVAPLYAEQRITFQNFAGSNYQSREVGEAFRSLEKARVLALIYPTTDTKAPAIPNQRKKPRLQFLDTGLTVHRSKLVRELLTIQDLNDASRGRIAQQIVTQNLLASHTSISYQNSFWVREKKGDAEVDLVYPHRGLIVPIEIKSGKVGKIRSLMEFIDRCEHTYAVRMYAGPFLIQQIATTRGKRFHLMNLPYYLSGELPEYLEYFMDHVGKINSEV